MPAEFPRDSFETVQRSLSRFSQQSGHSQFIGAWNAISYRYMGVVEYDEYFTASITEYGPAPAQPLRYRQERDLFGFFVSAGSVFDAYAFGMYAIGALLVPNNFSLAEEWKIDWKSTTTRYRDAFSNDPILRVLDNIWNDSAFEDIRNVRNVLTHRAVPPRHFTMSSRMATTRIADVDLTISETTTRSRREHLVRLLSTAVDATRTFVAAH